MILPVLGLLLCLQALVAPAQLSLVPQVRIRAELRNGVGALPVKGSNAAAFLSQRSRISLRYKMPRLVMQYSFQDVRVWGQDAGSISNADGNRLGTHEAWAEIILADKSDSTIKRSRLAYFSIKLGRQELVYDDQRLLGSLDWLQQGRRHDALLFRLNHQGWQGDAGLAFNQHTDAFSYNGTTYTPANVHPYVKDSRGNLAPTPPGLVPLTKSDGWSGKYGNPALASQPSTNGLNQAYKAMQFLYAARKWESSRVAILVFADHFGRYRTDSVLHVAGTDTGYIYGRRFDVKGVNSRITTGFQLNRTLGKNTGLQLQAGAWYQGGKDKDGLDLRAYMTTLLLSWSRGRMTYSAGWDQLSGNDGSTGTGMSERFDPLYGTPHKFWGLMDYFYAGTGSPVGGLNDYYLKSTYTGKRKRFTASADVHLFRLEGEQYNASGQQVEKYLGTELDLVGSLAVNQYASLELGLALMSAGESMAYAKGSHPAQVRNTGGWTYLSLNIRPEYFFK